MSNKNRIYRTIESFIHLWQRWGLKAGLSITDQGIFSSANLFLNILLVRWLMPAEYGIFAIAFSIFLFFSSFHQAFILEPMSVIGSAHYRDRLAAYLGTTVWIHAGLMFVLVGILVLIATVMAVKKSLLALSFFGLAIATPLILFFWLFRQACYLEMRPNLALRGSLTYALFLLLGLIVMRKQDWISPFSALFIMGFASLGASLIFWRYLGVKNIDLSWSRVKPVMRDILIRSWRYGRWGIGGAFVNWLSAIVYLPLVGIFAGLSHAGVFRAMQNMVLPIQRIITALGLLLLPWLSRQRVIQGEGYLKRSLYKFTVITILISTSYVIVLILFGRLIVRFLYGQSYYANFIWLLPYLGAVVVVESIAHGLYTGLKALERPDAIFWTNTAGVILTLTLGLYLVWKLKLLGAAVGLLLTMILIVIVLTCFLWRHFKKSKKIFV